MIDDPSAPPVKAEPVVVCKILYDPATQGTQITFPNPCPNPPMVNALALAQAMLVNDQLMAMATALQQAQKNRILPAAGVPINPRR